MKKLMIATAVATPLMLGAVPAFAGTKANASVSVKGLANASLHANAHASKGLWIAKSHHDKSDGC